MYAVVCDRNGIGQPVAIGFLSNERDENVSFFFVSVNDVLKDWNKVEAIFVDKDFQFSGDANNSRNEGWW